MKNYKLTVQYDGSRYKGWQRLGNKVITIQGRIEQVLCKMTGENIEIIGSGRTDAGVHAYKQIANFHTSVELCLGDIIDYCYRYLPEDIVVINAEEEDTMFHSRYHAKGKKYLYRIWNDMLHNPFMRKYSFQIKDVLDIDLMRKAASYLVGEHDFSSFTSLKSKKKSKVRTIYSIEIEKENKIIDVVFYANGFLYNMVRIITGTLIEAGTGRIEPELIMEALLNKERSLAGPTAPPQGLVLLDVEY